MKKKSTFALESAQPKASNDSTATSDGDDVDLLKDGELEELMTDDLALNEEVDDENENRGIHNQEQQYHRQQQDKKLDELDPSPLPDGQQEQQSQQSQSQQQGNEGGEEEVCRNAADAQVKLEEFAGKATNIFQSLLEGMSMMSRIEAQMKDELIHRRQALAEREAALDTKKQEIRDRTAPFLRNTW
ncbi:hypothetical protein SeLEV6574_g04423 [Synchytrium endobioticum]|nr:hypothetical protein SeLEV6574_g04423 [Synchytrium endobioticum]